MEKQTTNNETLNAKLRNMVQPIYTLLETLDVMKDNTITIEEKIRLLEFMPTLIGDAKKAVERLIN